MKENVKEEILSGTFKLTIDSNEKYAIGILWNETTNEYLEIKFHTFEEKAKTVLEQQVRAGVLMINYFCKNMKDSVLNVHFV